MSSPDCEPVPELVDEIVRAASDPSIWRYLTSDGRGPEGVRAYVAGLAAQWAAGAALPFVVRLQAPGRASAGRVVGVTRLKDAVRLHRRFTVGSWYAPEVWGTGVNAEAKGLLLAHAFEGLGALRVEFETDARNVRSQAALAALGVTREGLLRSHRIMRDGGRRDSVLYSVIDTDWPAVRSRIAARVAAQTGAAGPEGPLPRGAR